MSNGDSAWNRFSKLAVKVSAMVLDGTRKAEEVADWLQVVLSRTDFISVLTPPPREASVNLNIPPDGWAAEWQRFYKELFGQAVDFSGVELSPEQPGFGWVVMVAKGLTLNQVWAKCKESFPCFSNYGDDLERAVPTNVRTAAAAYAKRFRNRVEADEELKSQSANDLARDKVDSITLLERCLLELWYWWKTGGGHLDLLNITLCGGSRDTDGYVPGAYWRDDQFRVYNDDPDDSDGNLRARAAV